MSQIQVKQLVPGAEATILQVVNGVASWVVTDSGLIVIAPFTTTDATLQNVIQTSNATQFGTQFASGLTNNSIYRIALFTVVRDTTTNWWVAQNSQLWVRNTGGNALQKGIDQGPQTTYDTALATVGGTTIVSDGAGGLSFTFTGIAATHLAGTMKLYMQPIAQAAAV